jgi:hypothetical protein
MPGGLSFPAAILGDLKKLDKLVRTWRRQISVGSEKSLLVAITLPQGPRTVAEAENVSRVWRLCSAFKNSILTFDFGFQRLCWLYRRCLSTTVGQGTALNSFRSLPY